MIEEQKSLPHLGMDSWLHVTSVDDCVLPPRWASSRYSPASLAPIARGDVSWLGNTPAPADLPSGPGQGVGKHIAQNTKHIAGPAQGLELGAQFRFITAATPPQSAAPAAVASQSLLYRRSEP